MNPVAPPTQRMYTFAEVKAVPEPIPMQLLELGVPNIVPFCELYVCKTPYAPPLTPARVVHVRPCTIKVPPTVVFPVTFKDPVTVEFPVIAAPLAPTVSLSEVVKVPVMLLVPITDKPPAAFAI